MVIERFVEAYHLLSRWFLAQLIFRPWRWRRYVPPKRRLTLNGLHGVISQKMVLFIFQINLDRGVEKKGYSKPRLGNDFTLILKGRV
jgi:hypothetical protein